MAQQELEIRIEEQGADQVRNKIDNLGKTTKGTSSAFGGPGGKAGLAGTVTAASTAILAIGETLPALIDGITALGEAARDATKEIDRQLGILDAYPGSMSQVRKASNNTNASLLNLTRSFNRMTSSGIEPNSDEMAAWAAFVETEASAAGEDLDETLERLTDSLVGGGGELEDYNIKLQEGVTNQEQMRNILDQVSERFGDVETASNNVVDIFGDLETQFEDLVTETIAIANETGTLEVTFNTIREVAGEVAEEFRDMAEAIGLIEEGDTKVDALRKAVELIGSTVIATAKQFGAIITVISELFQTMQLLNQVLSGEKSVSEAWDDFKESVQDATRAFNNIGLAAGLGQLVEARNSIRETREEVDKFQDSVFGLQQQASRRSQATQLAEFRAGQEDEDEDGGGRRPRPEPEPEPEPSSLNIQRGTAFPMPLSEEALDAEAALERVARATREVTGAESLAESRARLFNEAIEQQDRIFGALSRTIVEDFQEASQRGAIDAMREQADAAQELIDKMRSLGSTVPQELSKVANSNEQIEEVQQRQIEATRNQRAASADAAISIGQSFAFIAKEAGASAKAVATIQGLLEVAFAASDFAKGIGPPINPQAFAAAAAHTAAAVSFFKIAGEGSSKAKQGRGGGRGGQERQPPGERDATGGIPRETTIIIQGAFATQAEIGRELRAALEAERRRF